MEVTHAKKGFNGYFGVLFFTGYGACCDLVLVHLGKNNGGDNSGGE
jgi:hypothetical protein